MEFDLTYNSQEAHLVISEYGRHIQNLIQYNKTIEDPKERQAFAEAVIQLMYQMNPNSKNTMDYHNKLWKHYFMIANYDIDVKATNGKIYNPEDDSALSLEHIDYPANESGFRHYGQNVRILIDKAINMEEGPIKDGFVETIASFMKLAYKNWNKEHYVSDAIILEDLKAMSKGKLSVVDESSLDLLSAAVKQKTRRPSNSRNNNRRRSSKHNKNRRRR